MKQKLENFSVSYMETIAGKRQRNVEWAKSAVKEERFDHCAESPGIES